MRIRNEIEPNEKFYRDAISDLKKHKRVYVYKEEVLEKIKEKYDDLNIRKWDFYWEVTR